jgi:hypothetical protein
VTEEVTETLFLSTCPTILPTLITVMKKVQITLELNKKSVKMIEKYLKEFDDTTLKQYLENELNNNPEVFIEYSGLDNI